MSNKPTHFAYTPILRKDNQTTFWHRVGSAWQSEKTISIELNSYPVNRKINLFVATDKLDKEEFVDNQQLDEISFS